MEKHFRVVLQLGYVFLVFHNIGVACEEYCDSETFEANCSSSQVIVMHEASYGRLRMGRCLQGDHGYVGCHEDFLHVLDGVCSGRRSCQFSVVTLREFYPPCSWRLKSYLEASYSCVTVLNSTSVKCNDTTIDIRSGPSIYLHYASDPDQMSSPSPSTAPTSTSNSDLSDSGVTMPFCPPDFLTEPGQRIDVTLYIFGYWKMSERSEIPDKVRPCSSSVYVIADGKQHSIELCEARNRVQRIYTRVVSQKSSSVIVYLGPTPGSSKDQMATEKFLGNYLIRVEAGGCPDLVLPPNSWIERNEEHIIVRCNFSMEVWYPVCRGDKWIGGPSSCSEVIRKEVCLSESFTAACPPGTVIIIRSALFGRMRSSRCIDFDNKDLDCYANVQPYLEAVCNGNSACIIGTHIETMRNAYIGRCSNNLTPYLHIGYTCVPAISEEVCDWEPLSVACSNETVILIRSALFGRMRSSRCIDFNTKNLDCFANVRQHVEGVCNGHTECNLESHIDTMRNAYIDRCPLNLKPYLHVIYTCVPDDFTKKVAIILSCVTAALIIFLAVVLVCIHKRRQRILINNEQDHAFSMVTESDE